MTTVSAFTITRPVDTREDDRDEDWRTRAGCSDADPTVFEPDDRGTPVPEAWDTPRAICNACPVIAQCLEDALGAEGRKAASARFGMRGGLNPEERYRTYRRRGRLGGTR